MSFSTTNEEGDTAQAIVCVFYQMIIYIKSFMFVTSLQSYGEEDVDGLNEETFGSSVTG